MTTVTGDTLSNTAPIFIRDVLKHNISTFANRVYKSVVVEDLGHLPCAVLDIDPANRRLVLDGSKYQNSFSLACEVFAATIKDRDELADAIMVLLRNPAADDAAGTTMRQQGIECERTSSSVTDFFVGEGDKVKNVKARQISAEFNFIY